MDDKQAKEYVKKALLKYVKSNPPKGWDFIQITDEDSEDIRFTVDFQNEKGNVLLISVDVQGGVLP
jgi:hypothetical protein